MTMKAGNGGRSSSNSSSVSVTIVAITVVSAALVVAATSRINWVTYRKNDENVLSNIRQTVADGRADRL